MRRLLSPRWLALHALAAGCVVGFTLLGIWQWDLGRTMHGTLRNLAYGVQWWVFAGFAVFMWWRVLRDEVAPPAERERAAEPAQTPARPTVPRYHPPNASSHLDDERDEELAAYNRFLAELHARSRPRSRPSRPA